ncbi:hypothetical protein EVAR_98267_1 [Eumeta japonica]|uniref:Uncharacterized protein n=1 Tax=Eumeta variegata TaxID=151549 RepID=A0A4C2A3F5_EUMVA|nr:hypothetical protein EVAR_98267_1 [Eumeta japonica]
MIGLKKRPSLRHGLIGVSGASGANTPVDSHSGPLRRLGVAQRADTNSPGPSRLPRVRVQITIADTSGASRRGRARRPRGPTQAVLSACVLPNAPCAALRAGPTCIFCDHPQFIEIPAQHHRTKADVAAF